MLEHHTSYRDDVKWEATLDDHRRRKKLMYVALWMLLPFRWCLRLTFVIESTDGNHNHIIAFTTTIMFGHWIDFPMHKNAFGNTVNAYTFIYTWFVSHDLQSHICIWIICISFSFLFFSFSLACLWPFRNN